MARVAHMLENWGHKRQRQIEQAADAYHAKQPEFSVANN
ncbi:hypothetical protein AA0119_g11529 [Alternaria tenuissima]|uniref:Uncharacterized protein n=2 Tax=Alternaria alternata complex TaxID=187734 RepID=A0A4Q4MZ45_ALTAL|nr:hypothetical protein AA0117_g12259 [Alternaria alternata]RYN89240.1 hypothetical protein AA0119_g11529 [Alternaria tenuissima]RYO04892.1 hypothetical protein AA0121_g12622 [Alternaria tenuissima]